MNREEYAQTLFNECLKLMKIAPERDVTISMYPYNGIYRIVISDKELKELWLCIDLYGDTEEELTHFYNKLMDYAEQVYEEKFNG